jgi:hypothetical protein
VLLGVAAMSAVVLVRIWLIDDRALGDLALIELEVRRVFSVDPPSLGAYSRFGWRHPGPVGFYVLALPYRALGSGAQSLSTGAVMLNAGWLVWAVSVLRRRGTAAVAAFGSCLLLMAAGLGVNGLGDAWNVSLTMLPFAVMMISCWGVLCGDRLARLPATVAFVFVVHTHVGVAVAATPLAAATVAAVLLVPDLRHRHRPTRRDVGIVSMIGFVALAPLLVDTVRRPPGNVADLVRWSLGDDRDVIGFAGAVRLLGRASSLSFPGRPEPPRFLLWVQTDGLGLLPGAFIVSMVVLGVIAWRRNRQEEMLISIVLSIVWISGVLAARSVPAPPEWWLVQWLQPLGWMTVAATGYSGWRLLIRPNIAHASVRTAGVGLVAAVVLVAGVAELRTISEFDGRSAIAVEPVDELTDAVEAAAEGRVVRIDTVDPDFSGENMLAGVANEAAKRGVEVCVDARLAYKFPDQLVCSGEEEVVLLLQTEPTVGDPPDGYLPIAAYDPLTPATRRRADATRAMLADALRAEGREELVGTLDTPLLAEALLADSETGVAARRDDVLWLDAVRERPGLRFGLYLRTP